MKPFKLIYTPIAANFIKKISPLPKKGLKALVEELALSPYLGKPLVEELDGYRSLRYNKYRVIYKVDDEKKLIFILFAGPRKDAYQLFTDFFKKMRQ
ncbi:type II toxin-antitoxin system RelE/ParE family toxin [bacterium]|nr:type II toxin-antitoxin system RelE/ParE family toxin [bacterium]